MSGVEEIPAERWPHGTRSRYIRGPCRCDDCRLANSRYYHARKGQPFNGLIDAGPARKHLRKLSRQGVGRRAVAAACDVSLTVIQEVRSGKKKRIRASTAEKILAVTPAARSDHSHVPVADVRRMLAELETEFFTKRAVARELGYSRSLQIGRFERVTAKNELRVKRLYRRATGQDLSA